MHALVAMILLIPLVVLAALGGLAVALLRLFKGEPTWPNRGSRAQRDEETRTIQELYDGLSKMEKRIAALETILLDPERKN